MYDQVVTGALQAGYSDTASMVVHRAIVDWLFPSKASTTWPQPSRLPAAVTVADDAARAGTATSTTAAGDAAVATLRADASDDAAAAVEGGTGSVAVAAALDVGPAGVGKPGGVDQPAPALPTTRTLTQARGPLQAMISVGMNTAGVSPCRLHALDAAALYSVACVVFNHRNVVIFLP